MLESRVYRCESCGYLVPDDEKHLGLCPRCSRDSLKEVKNKGGEKK